MNTIGFLEDGSDLKITNGSVFVSDMEAARQVVVSRLRLLQGEDAEDTGLGLDFRETNGGLQAARAKAIIALTTDGEGNALVSSSTVRSTQSASGQLTITADITIDQQRLTVETTV
jgi:hypothetical protein